MDAISLILTVMPFAVAIIFTAISIIDTKEIFMEKTKQALTPLWTFIAGISWIIFGIVSLYGNTTGYLVSLTWLYFIIGFIFCPILFFATMLQNINLAGKEKEANEMRLD